MATEAEETVTLSSVDGDANEQNAFKVNIPLAGPTFRDNISQDYYTTFMDDLGKDLPTLRSVGRLADYMVIVPLIEMICLYFAVKVDEIDNGSERRKLLGLEYDHEEAKEMKEKHPWLYVNEKAATAMDTSKKN